MQIEGSTRYDALKVAPPDPETMCKGQCEGTGTYPQKRDDPTITPRELLAWNVAHTHPMAHTEVKVKRVFFFWKKTYIVKVPCDGWHFIKCGDCGGTGRLAPAHAETK